LRESTLFEPFCVKIGWRSGLQGGTGKSESHARLPYRTRVAVKGLIIAPDPTQLNWRSSKRFPPKGY